MTVDAKARGHEPGGAVPELTEIDKYLFGYPAGKARLSGKLVPLVPEHRVYVEPFCGSAAVFFDKKPAPVEVLRDRDAEVVDALNALKAVTKRDLDLLAARNWIGARSTFDRLKGTSPGDKIALLHRFLYLTLFGFRRGRKSYAPDMDGHNAQPGIMRRLAKSSERMHQGVKISCGDYEKAISENNSADAFVFLDPPYPGYDVGVGESEFDETRFRKVLDSIKGKFLVTYGVRGKLDLSGFKTRKISPRRYLAAETGNRGPTSLDTLLISNYDYTLKLEDDLAQEVELDEQAAGRVAQVGAQTRAVAQWLDTFVTKCQRLSDSETVQALVNELPILNSVGADLNGFGEGRELEISGAPLAAIQAATLACKAALDEGLPEPVAEPLGALTGALGRLTATLPEVPALDDGDHPITIGKSDPLMAVPKASAPQPAVLQYHFRGKSLHADLRMRVDDHLIGWTIANQRSGSIQDSVDTIKEARECAKSFSVDGDRYSKPLREPRKLSATPKSSHSVKWLKVQGEVFGEGEVGATSGEPGVVVTVDKMRVEHGLQKATLHEYFVTGGKELNGVLLFQRFTGQPGAEEGQTPAGEKFWAASLRKDNLPHVLSGPAVEAQEMPPPGRSGMPSTLEEATPKQFRFWEAEGDEARKVRDALVASKHFSDGNIQIVGDQFRRVERKFYLAPPPEDVEPVGWLERVAEIVPAKKSLTESFGAIRDGKLSDVVCYDAGRVGIANAADLDEMVDKALALRSAFIISTFDAPHTRPVLARGGSVFKFRPDAGSSPDLIDRIFVASFPLNESCGIDWVGKAEDQGPGPHSQSQCMSCKAPPTVECVWADGRGRAWFCARHFKAWKLEEQRDIIREREVTTGRVGNHYGKDEARKAQDDLDAAEDELAELPAEMRKFLDREIRLLKTDEEHFVLGIVLEPETRDAQGDIYSAEEIRQAAHKFMERFQNIGHMHTRLVNDKVSILESYIAPVSFSVGSSSVKKGTWLFATRVNDPGMWQDVKSGALGGYSIGGSAVRRPDR